MSRWIIRGKKSSPKKIFFFTSSLRIPSTDKSTFSFENDRYRDGGERAAAKLFSEVFLQISGISCNSRLFQPPLFAICLRALLYDATLKKYCSRHTRGRGETPKFKAATNNISFFRENAVRIVRFEYTRKISLLKKSKESGVRWYINNLYRYTRSGKIFFLIYIRIYTSNI